jgi:hypothetical protein
LRQDNNQDRIAYVEIIENNIDDFVEELRAIDVIDLISFVRMERFPNIEDLVNSSTELFFKSGMLVFAWAAGVDLRWETRPQVTLGMEFRHPTVSLFFNLSINATERAVEILGVAFEQAWHDPVAHLRYAFRDARLPPRSRNPVSSIAAPRDRRGSGKPPAPC